MRFFDFALAGCVVAGVVVAWPALTPTAWAVQDQPVTIGPMETVCTGVGSAKDNPAWGNYPVKLTFSNTAGENEASEHIAITQGGKTVMETDCDAPWLLVRAPAGSYNVHASLSGRTANADFSVGNGGGQKTVNLAFASDKPAPNSMAPQ